MEKMEKEPLMSFDALTTAALALPPESRAELADTLLRSLDPKISPDILAAWATEAEDRLAAFERGEMKAFSREEVMRSLKSE
jgi:putative addiction module component (TIGR02574 family)